MSSRIRRGTIYPIYVSEVCFGSIFRKALFAAYSNFWSEPTS